MTISNFMDLSRILSIDFGKVRIGLAISDPLKIIARPLLVLENDGENSLRKISEIISDNLVDKVVIGLPLNLEGEETVRSSEVRAFAGELQEMTDVQIEFWDERYSSVEAEEVLKELGYTVKEAKNNVDKIAAAVILRNYLETTK